MKEYKQYANDGTNAAFILLILVKERKEHYRAYENKVQKIDGEGKVIGVASEEIDVKSAQKKADDMNRATLKELCK